MTTERKFAFCTVTMLIYDDDHVAEQHKVQKPSVMIFQN